MLRRSTATLRQAIAHPVRKVLAQKDITKAVSGGIWEIGRGTTHMIKTLYHRSSICQYPVGRKIKIIFIWDRTGRINGPVVGQQRREPHLRRVKV